MARTSKIDIQHLERDVDSDIFLRAEELLDNGCVKKVIRQESYLWILTIHDVTESEVEILLTRKGLMKGFSCDCQPNKGSKPCAHVITSLLYIRKNKTTPVKKKVIRQKLPKNIGIATIIERASSHELEQFVNYYSKKDKKFGHELKLYFADQIVTENDDQKYSILLDQIFKTHLTLHNKITTSSARYFLKIGSLLQEKVDSLMAYEDYSESINILFPLISKSYVILKKNNPNNPALIKFILETHELLSEFIELIKSPEIIQKVYDAIIELSHYSFYNILNPHVNIFSIALNNQKFKGHQESLHTRLKAYINKSEDNKILGLQTLALSYLNKSMYPKLTQLFHDYTDTSGLFMFLCQQLNERNFSPDQIIEIFSDISDSNWPTALKIKRSIILIEALSNLNRPIEALKLSIHSYQKHKKKSNLDAFIPKKTMRIEEIEKILDQDSELNPVIKKEIINYFGLRFLNGNRLYKFLNKNTSIEDIIKIDPPLLLSKKLELEQLIKLKISQYLNDHFGEQSLDFIRHILRRLDRLEIDDLRPNIIEYIHSNYKDRISLKELIY